jgi:hypothetical protein
LASGGLLAWWPAAEDGLSIRRLRHCAEIRGRERGGLVERVKPRVANLRTDCARKLLTQLK